jgi:hypothetical protein
VGRGRLRSLLYSLTKRLSPDGLWSLVDAVAAPALLLLVAGVGILTLVSGTHLADRLQMAGISLRLLAIFVAVIISVWLAAAVLPRLTPWREPWKRFGRAVVADIGLTILICGALWYLVQQHSRVMQTAVTFGEQSVAEFLARTVETKRETGVFPRESRVVGPVSFDFDTQLSTSDKAVYQASVSGVPGTFVAEISETEGMLYWHRGNTPEWRDTLVVGRVERVEQNPDGSRALVQEAGKRRELELISRSEPILLGQRYMTYVDAATDKATGLFPLHGNRSSDNQTPDAASVASAPPK